MGETKWSMALVIHTAEPSAEKTVTKTVAAPKGERVNTHDLNNGSYPTPQVSLRTVGATECNSTRVESNGKQSRGGNTRQNAKKLPNSRFLKVGNAKYSVHHICWTVGKSRNSTGKIHAVQMDAQVVFMCGEKKVATLHKGSLSTMKGTKILLGKKHKLGGQQGFSRKTIESFVDTFVEDADHPKAEQVPKFIYFGVGPHITAFSPNQEGTITMNRDLFESVGQYDGNSVNTPVMECHTREVAFAIWDSQPPRRGQRVVGHKTKPIHSTQKVQYAQSPRNPVVEQSEHWRLEDGRWVTETRTFVDGIEQYPMPTIGDRPDTIMSPDFRKKFGIQTPDE